MYPRDVPGPEAEFRAWWQGHTRLVVGLLLWASAMLLVTLSADPELRQIGGGACDASLLSWF